MRTPVIHLSDSARRALQEAAVDAGGDPLRMRISDRFEYDLFFGSRAEDDLDVDCGGITILLDPTSVRRADGLSIDFVSGPDGAGFTIDNPNEPSSVRQISATELKAMMDGRLSFELVDVRTEEERAIAKIEGSRVTLIMHKSPELAALLREPHLASGHRVTADVCRYTSTSMAPFVILTG